MATHASDPAKDSESRVAEIIAILTVASVLSTLTVGLRCYCRAFMLRSFGWDDGVLLPAQVCLTSFPCMISPRSTANPVNRS
jgi:hypothetical protein